MTPEINIELDNVDKASKSAGEKLAKRRHPRFNFIEMDIPIGSELVSSHNDETCKVIDKRKVLYRNEEVSLTRATRLKLENDYDVAPGRYWVFEGTLLSDLYRQTYYES